MNHAKCDTLLEASKALLRKSGLARWDDQTFAFVPMIPTCTSGYATRMCAALS